MNLLPADGALLLSHHEHCRPGGTRCLPFHPVHNQQSMILLKVLLLKTALAAAAGWLMLALV